MSGNDDRVQPEQDTAGPGDDLPTYDDLASQSGPNSRFGRWRGWIEKRAAERYRDLTSEERQRRRARGWGNDGDQQEAQGSDDAQDIPQVVEEPPTPPPGHQLPLHLRIHTDLPSLPPPQYEEAEPLSETPPAFTGQLLSPSQLRLNQFGSRFLPHATSPIRCLLPLLNDRLVLIGHDEGLSVLDMFPQEWTDTGTLHSKGPDEAVARLMWQGEAVLQISILEIGSIGEGTPQGVVLALVGPQAESSRDNEPLRSLRMYNLASLISLAKWTVAQKGARPVTLHRAPKWDSQQTPTKRHRPHSSITKGLRALMVESPSQQSEPHTSSYQNLVPSNVQPNRNNSTPTPVRQNSASPSSITDSWDVIDDLPLRWATDYVPLASQGSRLVNTSVSSYALWHDGNARGRGGALLAVATKANILLYEKPKGERAFRFVKEFYTPIQPRNITFIQQSVQDIVRSVSDVGSSSRYQPLASSDSLQPSPSIAATKTTIKYSSQLSIFVVFDKKAGVIRIADSSVNEVDLPHDPHHPEREASIASMSSSTGRRSRLSDMGNMKGSWILPTRIELPAVQSSRQATLPRMVYFLTRGKQTQVLSSPLPANIASSVPLHSVKWETQPTSITPKICLSPGDNNPPFLQLVALGEDGIEVQELSLSFLNRGKDKGKGRAEEPIRASADINGNTGFLCTGGHWHRPGYPNTLSRSMSVATDISATSSFDSLETEEIVSKMQQEQGIYGWSHVGMGDWRVFWVGGSGAE